MYTITLKSATQRDETITFPRDTTIPEIIDAATFYSKQPCTAIVKSGGETVAMAMAGSFSALEDTDIGQYMSTTQLRLLA